MLFSNEERCHYERSVIHETICQLRFPTILKIQEHAPADFQDQIRGTFPRYAANKETPPVKVIQQGGQAKVETQPSVTNYSFLSEDTLWKLNLTRDFIALSTLRYPGWETFAAMLDKALAAFIRIYQPAFFERIGLRYMNIVSRSALGLEQCRWADLIQEAYLGPMAEEDVSEEMFRKYAMDMELPLDSSSRVKVHAGPAFLKPAGANTQPETEQKFIFDMDLSMSGNISAHFAAGGLETLHGHAYRVFRGAITEELHQAMQPR